MTLGNRHNLPLDYLLSGLGARILVALTGLLSAVILLCPAVGFCDQPPCLSITKIVPLSHKLATAGSWANVRNSEGSLKFETRKMLQEAAQSAEGKLSPPSDLCPDYCAPSPAPDIVFESVPNKYLPDYGDYKKCDTLLKRTTSAPFQYEGKRFGSIDAFADWFANFSQGSGDEGKDLYAKCDGDCSPQYKNYILPKGESLTVTASVICGHARDKDDNQYNISAFLRWRCEEKR